MRQPIVSIYWFELVISLFDQGLQNSTIAVMDHQWDMFKFVLSCGWQIWPSPTCPPTYKLSSQVFQALGVYNRSYYFRGSCREIATVRAQVSRSQLQSCAWMHHLYLGILKTLTFLTWSEKNNSEKMNLHIIRRLERFELISINWLNKK